MPHVLDGSALHELRLVFGGLLQAARVHVAVEHRLVRAHHHRGMVPAQPMGDPHGSQRDFADGAEPRFLQFFPKVAPVGGETEVTLCGWEFQSSLRPAIINGKTHSIAVGSTVCAVLPKKSSSEK